MVSPPVPPQQGIQEIQARRQFESKLRAAEAEAKAQHEKDLEAEIKRIRAEHASMISTEKAKFDINAMIAAATVKERAKFQKELKKERAKIEQAYQQRVKKSRQLQKRQLRAAVGEAKRQAARGGTYAEVTPRRLQQYRRTQMGIFESAVSAETEVFKQEAKAWEERAVGTFETGLGKWQKEEAAKQQKALVAWEESEVAQLEKNIASYRTEAGKAFSREISEWKRGERAEKLEPAITAWKAGEVIVTPISQVEVKGWKPMARFAEPPKGAKPVVSTTGKGWSIYPTKAGKVTPSLWGKPVTKKKLSFPTSAEILAWKAPALPTWEVTLAEIPVKGGKLHIGLDIGKWITGAAEATTAAAGGVVSSGESLAYGTARLVGMEAPAPPPTLTGAAISTIPESIAAGKIQPSAEFGAMAERVQKPQYAVPYALGSLLGDVLLSYATGKGIEKGVAAVGRTGVGAAIGGKLKPITTPITKPLTAAQAKIGKLTEPVTRRMVGAAEAIISPFKGVSAIDIGKSRLGAFFGQKLKPITTPIQQAWAGFGKPVTTTAPKGLLIDLKPTAVVDDIAAAVRAEARVGSITQTILPEELVIPKEMLPTAAERWTARAGRELSPYFAQMKPISQLKYGASWGEPYVSVKPITAPVPSEAATRAWAVRATKAQLAGLPTAAERWTSAAERAVPRLWEGMKPITEIPEGISFGKPYPKPRIPVQEKWIVRGMRAELKGLPTAVERWTSAAERAVPSLYQMKPLTEIPEAISYGKPYLRPRVPTAQRAWTVRAVKHQLGMLPIDLEQLPFAPTAEPTKLPKKFTEYVKPLKAPKAPPTGRVVQAGKQALIMEQPLLKAVPKVAPKVRITKWVIRAQKGVPSMAKEVLKVSTAVRVTPTAAVAKTALKMEQAAEVGFSLSSVIGVTVTPKLAVRQKVRQQVGLKIAPVTAAAIGLAQPSVVKAKAREAVISVPKLGLEQPQIEREVPVQVTELTSALMPPIPRAEKKKRRRRKKKGILLIGKMGALKTYPIRKEEDVPSFLLGGLLQKQGRSLSVGQALFGKRRRKRK